MASLPATRPFTQRKPLPPVEASGQLTTGADRIADLLNEAAVLEITSPTGTGLYWLGADVDPATGKIASLTLRQFATGTVYKIAIDGDRFECDCPDSTYRNRRCKHLSAVADALTHSEGQS